MASRPKRAAPKRGSPKGATRKPATPKRELRAVPARKRAGASRPVKPPVRPSRPKVTAGIAPGMQPVNAYLAVRDVAAALDHYQRAFGFKRRFAMPGDDGTLMHAEMTHRESVMMMGPESAQERASATAAPRMSLYVYVTDVDKVAAQARAAGSTITEEPKDQFWGDRTATVVDPDGHRWTIATFKKQVAPEDMKPPM